MVKEKIGLYIHIPFCINKCPYCDFYSLPKRPSQSLEKEYLKALKTELNFLSTFLENNFKIEKISFLTFYAGGGTPSLVSPNFYEKLFNFLSKNFNFSPIELTFEANPETLSLNKTKTFYELGFNRISLGIQSLSLKGLKFLERKHTLNHIFKAIEYINKCNFKNFSLDFIFGWKGQGEKTLKRELTKALKFSPSHFSFYELTLEKNTPFYKRFKGKKYWLKEKKILNFYKIIEETLALNGYIRYEISNYAKPNFECKHNLLYWKLKPYLGLGPSAVSRIGNLRWENPRNLYYYMESLLKLKKLPLKIIETLDNFELAKEYIFMGLRLKEGIDLIELKKRYNCFFKDSSLNILKEKNLIEIKENKLYLTFKGKLLHNQIVNFLWKNLQN